jgi:hypothetical protein
MDPSATNFNPINNYDYVSCIYAEEVPTAPTEEPSTTMTVKDWPLYNMMDANYDGEVSYAEFVTLFMMNASPPS